MLISKTCNISTNDYFLYESSGGRYIDQSKYIGKLKKRKLSGEKLSASDLMNLNQDQELYLIKFGGLAECFMNYQFLYKISEIEQADRLSSKRTSVSTNQSSEKLLYMLTEELVHLSNYVLTNYPGRYDLFALFCKEFLQWCLSKQHILDIVSDITVIEDNRRAELELIRRQGLNKNQLNEYFMLRSWGIVQNDDQDVYEEDDEYEDPEITQIRSTLRYDNELQDAESIPNMFEGEVADDHA